MFWSLVLDSSEAALHSWFKNISYWVSCFTLLLEVTDWRNLENIWEPLSQSMFVYSSCSPRNVSCGCAPTVVSTSPWRHPLAVRFTMFSSQFPTVQRHKQVYSAGLIAAGISQEKGEKKQKKRKGVGAYSFWMFSRSLKCHVSAPDILLSFAAAHWDTASTCNSQGGNPPRRNQTDVCECECEEREDTTRLAIIQTTHSLLQGECISVIG